MTDRNLIAIDLAKSVFQVCVFSRTGGVVSNRRHRRAELKRFMAQQRPSLVGMEACYSSHYWGRLLNGYGHEVRLIPAQHVKPFVRGNKNDANDAIAIGEASKRPNLRVVPVKTIEQQDMQALHRIRQRLMKNRIALSNQVRGLLSEYGIVFGRGHKALVENLRGLIAQPREDLSVRMQGELVELLEEYQQLCTRLRRIDRQIDQHAHGNALCVRLMTIPGIGVVVASALVAAIGNGAQFSSPRALAVWLGLTPRQYASGDRNHMGAITKRGDRYLRRLLIHGARAALHRRRRDDRLSRWAKAVAERRGNAKATVALAHKIARLAWVLLQREQSYRSL